MLQLQNFDIYFNINLNLSFALNQSSNIFYLKILNASFSTSDLPYINFDITFYISTLAPFQK